MYPYQDPKRSVDERVEDLLSRMTLEEKFAQICLMFLTPEEVNAPVYDDALFEKLYRYHGSTYNTLSLSDELLCKIQDWGKKNTRLGIPIAIHGEGLHGNKHKNATVFPQAIGLGATFNPELINKIATVTGKEARANGISMVYAPNLDISRDARWGRVEENYGEDPYLTQELGVAYVKGVQSQGVASCPKHFALYSTSEGGINLAPIHMGEREVWEYMLPPFQKAIEAGAMAIMPSYSEWDGIPSHANKHLMVDILRDRLGFEGQVVSDYGALSMLRFFQKVAADRLTAGKMALNAQVDVEACKKDAYGPELEQAVRDGEVSEEAVDRAVRRVLRHKFELGLFEDPYPHPETPRRTAESIALARRAGQESVTLLKNENRLLPLSDSIGSIAIIGPNADSVQLGDYSAEEAIGYGITLRRALEERLGADRVYYARGCGIASTTEENVAAAVEAVRKAELTVVVLGDNSSFHSGVGWGDADPDGTLVITSGEGFDVSSLELPDCQQQLLELAVAQGKPVILIMESGRPYSIRWAKENVPAILQAWYPGEQGGYALADILFGDVDPSGRLPISFPMSVGHIPCHYNHKISARGYYRKPGTPENPGRDYVFSSPAPLFAFGEGLSYTTFAYSGLQVEVTGKNDAKVTVTLENTGDRYGCEVVQLYVSDKICRIAPYVRRLRGFEKLWLQPGEKRQVSFDLGFEDFAFVNEKMELEVEPGEFVIRVGTEEATITL